MIEQFYLTCKCYSNTNSESDDNEWMLHIPQSFCTWTSQSDVLMSYLGHLLVAQSAGGL